MGSIEQAITRGRVVYFHSIAYEPQQHTITLHCLPNPPESAVIRSVIFRDIVELRTEWSDGELPDPDCIETLIGADSHGEQHTGLVRYVIQTDLRCLRFASSQPPDVLDHA